LLQQSFVATVPLLIATSASHKAIYIINTYVGHALILSRDNIFLSFFASFAAEKNTSK